MNNRNFSNIILLEDNIENISNINNNNINNNNNNSNLINNINNMFQDLISVDMNMNIENVKNKKIKYENTEYYNIIQQYIIDNITENNDIYIMLKIIEKQIFENLLEKIDFIKKNYLKIDEYDLIKEISDKDLKSKMSSEINNKYTDIILLYEKFKKSNKNEITENIEKYVDSFEINKKKVNDYEIIMNISKNYLKYINDQNIFDFDIIKHIENQKKIINECVKKNKEFDEIILDIRKTLKKYSEWNIESNKYLSLIKNIKNDINKETFENEKINIYNIIKDFNDTLYKDDLILLKIKNAINLKIELDYCFNLICKYGSKIETNMCSICYTNKISCCYVPCGHTYCIFCAYNSPNKCMNCREQNVKIQKIFL